MNRLQRMLTDAFSSNGQPGWTGGQYSVFRLLLGGYLVVHFLHLMPWGPELFSFTGMLANGTDSPLFGVLPNVLALSDAPGVVKALLLSGALAALALALGMRDRMAALWCWYVLMCVFTRNPLIANPALPYVGWMLLAHALVPRAPFGSYAAAGEPGAGHGWRLPRAVWVAATLLLAITYSYSGYTKLLSPSWVSGDTLAYVLENPLARDWFLRDLFLLLPDSALKGITWFILYVELLYLPLLALRKLRFALWAGMLGVQFGFLFLLNFPDLTFGMLLFHLLTFDPRWVKSRDAAPATLYYDGDCGLCHRVVRFVLSEDSEAVFRFAPLNGSHHARRMDAACRAALPDSFVVHTADGRWLTEGDALIFIGRRLGGLWRLAAEAFSLVPGNWRNRAYHLVGDRRQTLFRKPDSVCPLVPATVRHRFLMMPAEDAA